MPCGLRKEESNHFGKVRKCTKIYLVLNKLVRPKYYCNLCNIYNIAYNIVYVAEASKRNKYDNLDIFERMK